MARTVNLVHREQLLDGVAQDLLANGLVGASLDRLATAAGTTARMLVHHFGSRDALMEAAIRRCRARELSRAQIELPADPDFLSRLVRAWRWFSSDEAAEYFRLFGQVAALSRLGDTDAAVSRSRLSTEWLDLFSAGFAAVGMRPAESRRMATLVLAQVRGLLLDLDATGDARRVARAYRDFVELAIDETNS